jgi:hypothetical protein
MTRIESALPASVVQTSLIPLNADHKLDAVSPAESEQPALIPNFTMQCQCHSNWCWAAVAASVSAYYDPGSDFTQCKLANIELHRNDCCDVPCHTDDAEFNVLNTLASPLNRVGCLLEMRQNQRATPAEVQQETEAARPLCVRVVWRGGGGHFLAIVGYVRESRRLVIKDPFFQSTEIDYDQFCTQYQNGRGVWTDTYYTTAAS